MRFFSVLSFSLIGLLLGSDLQARPDRDLRQLIEQRIRQLNAAVSRCQQRISSGEINDCNVNVDWEDTTVSMGAAQSLANEMRAGLGTFVVTTKSFIRRIDLSSLSPVCSRTRAESLLAAFSNLNFSEDPATPAVDANDFRLFSQSRVTVLCSGDEITNWQIGDLETAFGSELGILGADGAIDEPLAASPSLDGDYRVDGVTFSYRIIGQPNAKTLFSFKQVCNRSCSWIWHRVEGEITCSDGRADVGLTVTVSHFPSHRAWINSHQQPTNYQGPFSALWDCDPSNPQMVQ